MEKPALRAEARRTLRAISSHQQQTWSAQIRENLENHLADGRFATIAAYAALPGEPDLDTLFEGLPLRWALPRMVDDRIELRKIRTLNDLLVGAYQIREPDPERCPVVSISETDLIIVPGLTFCAANGARLGRGKGHYDRFLAGIKEGKKPPFLLGVCFSTQLRDTLPLEPHDILMDGILTETALRLVR